jgi:putative ABC transport system permease protein
MYRDFLKLAFRNILNRRRRSWLTVVGIFIGIAAVVSLVALGQGLDQSITDEFERIGADKIFVNPGASQTSTTGFAESSAVLDGDDLAAIRRVRGVDAAEGSLFRSARVSHRDDSQFVTVIGMPAGSDLVTEAWNFETASGRMIRGTDRSSVTVGARLADSAFNDQLDIRSKLELDGRAFRVAGILEPSGDPEVDRGLLLPYDRAKAVFETGDQFDYIIVRVQDGFDPETVKANVERELRRERGLEPGDEDFTVSTPQDIIGSFRNVLSIVQAIVVGIASISLLVGGVGIMNTMYTAVNDRTREIGVMKAIGAKNRDVLVIFLFESGIIGLFGGLVGVAVGAGISVAAARAATQYSSIPISAAISPELVAGALLFSFGVGTVSGVLPARNAARLQPVDALRYE